MTCTYIEYDVLKFSMHEYSLLAQSEQPTVVPTHVATHLKQLRNRVDTHLEQVSYSEATQNEQFEMTCTYIEYDVLKFSMHEYSIFAQSEQPTHIATHLKQLLYRVYTHLEQVSYSEATQDEQFDEYLALTLSTTQYWHLAPSF